MSRKQYTYLCLFAILLFAVAMAQQLFLAREDLAQKVATKEEHIASGTYKYFDDVDEIKINRAEEVCYFFTFLLGMVLFCALFVFLEQAFTAALCSAAPLALLFWHSSQRNFLCTNLFFFSLLLYLLANGFLLVRAIRNKEMKPLPGFLRHVHWIGFVVACITLAHCGFVYHAARNLARENHHDLENFAVPYVIAFAVLLLLPYLSGTIAPYVATFFYAPFLRHRVLLLDFNASCHECFTDADRLLETRAEQTVTTISRLTAGLLLFSAAMLFLSLLLFVWRQTRKSAPDDSSSAPVHADRERSKDMSVHSDRETPPEAQESAPAP